MLEVVIAVIGSSALASFISGIFTTVAKKKDLDSGIAAGVRMLLYDRIKYIGCQCIKAGKISNSQLEDLIKMHKIYHNDLHGNGYLDELMSDVKDLPRV